MKKTQQEIEVNRFGREGHRLRRSVIRWPGTLIVLGLLFGVALSGNVQAQSIEFAAVIVNPDNVRHPTAQIDVSMDTDGGTGIPVTFQVFNAENGTRLSDFVLYTNVNGFCSSSSAAAPNDNLFSASGGRTALVKVRMPIGVSASTAVMREDLGGSRIVFAVPPIRDIYSLPFAAYQLMPVAIGDLEKGTTLLIANVSSDPVEVTILFGTSGFTPGGSLNRYTNRGIPINAVWSVDLQPGDANSHVEVRSSDNVTVQLVVNQGKGNISETTVLRP